MIADFGLQNNSTFAYKLSKSSRVAGMCSVKGYQKQCTYTIHISKNIFSQILKDKEYRSGGLICNDTPFPCLYHSLQ